MSEVSGKETPASYIVIDSMNRHGAITVQSTEDHATYHVVEHADSETRDRLASLTEGAQVRMSVERAGVRANAWEATRVVSGSVDPTRIRA